MGTLTGEPYMYAFVFKIFTEHEKTTKYQRENSFKQVLDRLNFAGFDYHLYYSVDKKEVIVKIRTTEEFYKLEANRINMRVLADPNELQRVCDAGIPGKSIEPLKLHECDLEGGGSKRKPYESIYLPFKVNQEEGDDFERLYKKYPDGSYFQTVNKLKLIESMLENSQGFGGAGLNLRELFVKKAVLGVFPLHTPDELAKLSAQWIRWRPITRPYEQPLTAIKDYFGERVGLYFAWLGFYTKWLIIPAFLGTIVQIWSLAVASGEKGEEYNPDIPVASAYGLMITIWCTLFCEFWKRNEATLAMEWGTVGFESEEGERPEFSPAKIIEHSPIDGKYQKFFSPNTRKKLVTQSWVVISMGLVIVIGAVVGVVGFRYWSTKLQCEAVTEPDTSPQWWADGNGGEGCVQIYVDGLAAVPNVCETICDNTFLETNGATIASIMNAFQIQLLGTIFKGIAEFLNNRENHRTDTEYTDALIAKEFLFQFVNSYSAVFYTGFIKGTILKGDACINADGLETNCFNELSQQLAIIFIIRLISGNLMEIGIPTAMAYMKKRQEQKNARKMASGDGGEAVVVELTDAEEQFILAEYDDKGIFADYSEMMVQFGYSTLFVTAFPFAPAMSLLNNYVEIRVDAMKLTRTSRRPFPRSAEDIGTWQTILELMGTAAVISNVYLICFTSSQQNDVDTKWKAWEFLILEHAVLGFKFALALLVPDAPEDVKMQIQRREIIESKVIELEPDEDDSFDVEAGAQKQDFSVGAPGPRNNNMRQNK